MSEDLDIAGKYSLDPYNGNNILLRIIKNNHSLYKDNWIAEVIIEVRGIRFFVDFPMKYWFVEATGRFDHKNNPLAKAIVTSMRERLLNIVDNYFRMEKGEN